MIKFHQKYFIESIMFEDVNPEQIRHSNYNFRNILNIENKLTRFQIYPETELACKYNKPLYKTQYSEIIVEYEDMNTGKLIIHPMATSRKAWNNRNKAKTEHSSKSHCYPQSPVTHILAHQLNIEDTYEQIVEQPSLIFVLKTTIFLAHDEPLDWIPQPSFLTHPVSNVTLLTYQSLTSLPLLYEHSLIIYHAWILMMIAQTHFFIPCHNFKIPILTP